MSVYFMGLFRSCHRPYNNSAKRRKIARPNTKYGREKKSEKAEEAIASLHEVEWTFSGLPVHLHSRAWTT